jgi:hypothetical protein
VAGLRTNGGGPRSLVLDGTPEAIADRLHAYHGAGMQHVVCMLDSSEERGPQPSNTLLTAHALERFVLVLEALRKLESRADHAVPGLSAPGATRSIAMPAAPCLTAAASAGDAS